MLALSSNVAYQQKLELCKTSNMVHVNSQKDELDLTEFRKPSM